MLSSLRPLCAGAPTTSARRALSTTAPLCGRWHVRPPAQLNVAHPHHTLGPISPSLLLTTPPLLIALRSPALRLLAQINGIPFSATADSLRTGLVSASGVSDLLIFDIPENTRPKISDGTFVNRGFM